MENLETLTASARQAIGAAQDIAALEELRVQYLGKKGSLTELLKGLGQLPPEQRPAAGAEINRAKELLQSAFVASLRKLGSRLKRARKSRATITTSKP
jgi:phenylalanyl-tRNA synthetase alpha chain